MTGLVPFRCLVVPQEYEIRGGYENLLRLSWDIAERGLMTPFTVTPQDQGFVVLSGLRRHLAISIILAENHYTVCRNGCRRPAREEFAMVSVEFLK